MRPPRPHHGGGLNRAVKKYGIEQARWLDLSTGINPNGWPVPTIPAAVYNRLPESDDGLLDAARHYYQNKNLIPVCGSQQAIQLLPTVLQQLKLIPQHPRVGMASPAYAEHEFSWRQLHSEIIYPDPGQLSQSLAALDVLVLINPNNPGGQLYPPDILAGWQQQLRDQGSLLIIDEAFMDCTPEHSLLSRVDMEQADNLVILRSVGKFFGLAGIRSGFLAAHPTILERFRYIQGPWSVSNPAQYITRLALSDTQWIQASRKLLHTQSESLEKLLQDFLRNFDPDATIRGTRLFKTVFSSAATELYTRLAQRGILTRLLDNQSGVRFGLPADTRQFQLLEKVLNDISNN